MNDRMEATQLQGAKDRSLKNTDANVLLHIFHGSCHSEQAGNIKVQNNAVLSLENRPPACICGCTGSIDCQKGRHQA